MQLLLKGFRHYTTFFSSTSGGLLNKLLLGSQNCFYSTYSEEPELKDLTEFLDSLNNYEKSGVPKGAGTDSDEGFDLGRMKRLMERLGNPQSQFKAVHIAGTKGKGSTAAYLSNILQAEGYSVGSYTSPHILSIRERMSVGKGGQPISSKALSSLFQRIKHVLDSTIRLENGSLSHFEVITAMAFALFAQENVDIALVEAGLGGARDATNVICSSQLAAAIITTIGEEHMAALGGSLESIALAKSGITKHGRPLVLGGPFLPHIEKILLDKALSMNSPVISASDAGIIATIKELTLFNDRPCQSCDIIVKVERDFPLSLELFDIHLRMVGNHQLQNAVTAACTALCLREQGWKISNESIRTGLENTSLVGRSQFLTAKEADGLGLHGARILLDGAHTKDSAKALVDTIQMTFPVARLALVVAMAKDKDHLAFAREFLSARHIDAVFLTEAQVAGGKARITPVSMLRNFWVQATEELGIDIIHDEMAEYKEVLEENRSKTVLAAENSLAVSMQMANRILKKRAEDQPGIIVVTGSLHIISSVLSSFH